MHFFWLSRLVARVGKSSKIPSPPIEERDRARKKKQNRKDARVQIKPRHPRISRARLPVSGGRSLLAGAGALSLLARNARCDVTALCSIFCCKPNKQRKFSQFKNSNSNVFWLFKYIYHTHKAQSRSTRSPWGPLGRAALGK